MNTKKTLIATLALATLVASPAFAQSSTHRVRHSNTAVDNANVSEGNASTRNPNVVILGNRVVGQDPDINIRSQLIRDPNPGTE